jgi:MFS family permease
MTVLVSISLLLTGLIVPEEKSLGMNLDRPKISFRKIMTNRKLRGAFVYRAVNSMGISTIMGFLPLFAVQVLSISETTVGFILSAGIFATAFLQSPMGILADRLNKKLMLIVGGLISSTGYFYIIHTQNIVELFISRLLVTAGGILSIPAITAIIAEEGKKLGSGSTMGIYNTAMSVGRIVGPIFIGFLLDTYGMSAVFNFTGVIGILSILAFYLFSRGND